MSCSVPRIPLVLARLRSRAAAGPSLDGGTPAGRSDEGGRRGRRRTCRRRARSRRSRCRSSRRGGRRSGGALPAGADGARVEVCADRACTRAVTSFDASGDHGAPPDDLPAGRRLLAPARDAPPAQSGRSDERDVGARRPAAVGAACRRRGARCSTRTATATATSSWATPTRSPPPSTSTCTTAARGARRRPPSSSCRRAAPVVRLRGLDRERGRRRRRRLRRSARRLSPRGRPSTSTAEGRRASPIRRRRCSPGPRSRASARR